MVKDEAELLEQADAAAAGSRQMSLPMAIRHQPPSPHDSREYSRFERGGKSRGGSRGRGSGIGASGPWEIYRASDGAEDALRLGHGHDRSIRYSVGKLRLLALRSPFIQSYIRQIKNGVIGKDAIAPTFSGVPRPIKLRLREAFDLWAEDCCLIDEMSLLEVQHAVVEALVTDGRTFVICQHSPAFEGVPMRLLHLGKEMHRSDISIRDQRIHNGIRYDEWMRPTHYIFQKFDSMEFIEYAQSQSGVLQGFSLLGGWKGGGSLQGTIEVDAAYVCDIHPSSLISRSYNYPTLLLSFFEVLEGVANLDLALLRLLDSGAHKGGFLRIDPAQGGGALPAGMPPPTVVDLNREKPLGHGIDVLPVGTDFIPYQTGYPTADTHKARKEIIRSMAAAGGIDYNSLTSDAESINFSSLRHQTIQTREHFGALARLIILRFMRKVTKQFIALAPAAGRLSGRMIAKALASTFEVRSFPWVDPRNDAEASAKHAMMGTKSLNQLARDNGTDLFDNIEERLDVADYLQIEGTPAEKLAVVRDLFMTNGLVAASPQGPPQAVDPGMEEAGGPPGAPAKPGGPPEDEEAEPGSEDPEEGGDQEGAEKANGDAPEDGGGEEDSEPTIAPGDDEEEEEPADGGKRFYIKEPKMPPMPRPPKEIGKDVDPAQPPTYEDMDDGIVEGKPKPKPKPKG